MFAKLLIGEGEFCAVSQDRSNFRPIIGAVGDVGRAVVQRDWRMEFERRAPAFAGPQDDAVGRAICAARDRVSRD